MRRLAKNKTAMTTRRWPRPSGRGPCQPHRSARSRHATASNSRTMSSQACRSVSSCSRLACTFFPCYSSLTLWSAQGMCVHIPAVGRTRASSLRRQGQLHLLGTRPLLSFVTHLLQDYRGLFESHGPKRIHRMSIREHGIKKRFVFLSPKLKHIAEDLHEIINAENIKQIEVLLGHS